MYSTEVSHVKMVQCPKPAQLSVASNKRSPWLIGFGIVEILVSVILITWCAWTIVIDLTSLAPYFGIAFAAFHVALGIVAIVCGVDGVRYRKCTIGLLVCSVIGACMFVASTISAFAISWFGTDYSCNYCIQTDKYGNYDHSECRNICTVTVAAFAPSMSFIIILLITGIVLSCVSSCRLCKCCGCCYAGDTNTSNVEAQVFVYHPMNV